MPAIAIGIDLGGTRIKSVALDEQGHTIYQQYQDTEDCTDALWKCTIAGSVSEIQNNFHSHLFSIGIAAPGLPNAGNSAIAFMPGRLEGLENFEWSEYLKTRAFVLNDAVSALIAEARYGAAINRKHVIMVTLGTGVGGAILIDGKPYQGAFNKAGHIGHMVIDSEGEQDIIGIPGSLEEAIGNCSIAKRTKGRYQSTRELLIDYRKGDPYSSEVWLTSIRKLAVGLASLTNILSPEMIILGGGITEAGDDLIRPLEQFMDQYEWRTGGKKAEIVLARYGDFAGAVGAACFARDRQNSTIP